MAYNTYEEEFEEHIHPGKDFFYHFLYVWRGYIRYIATLLSKKLGKKVVIDEKVEKKVEENYKNHGVPYCPCRVKKIPENICPCIYLVKDLEEKGRCLCGLFKVKDDE